MVPYTYSPWSLPPEHIPPVLGFPAQRCALVSGAPVTNYIEYQRINNSLPHKSLTPPVVAVNSWEIVCKYSAPSVCCWDSAMHVLNDFQHSPETFSFQALRGPWMDNTLLAASYTCSTSLLLLKCSLESHPPHLLVVHPCPVLASGGTTTMMLPVSFSSGH